MKAFQIGGDEKRIYFQNYERRSGEEELEELIDVLQKAGCQVGTRVMAGIDDIYRCKKDGLDFDIIYGDEEAFIYSDNPYVISDLMKLFD